MSKGKHSKPRGTLGWLWDKVIISDIIPIVWGALVVITITATLTSLGIVSVRWLLSLMGVSV